MPGRPVLIPLLLCSVMLSMSPAPARRGLADTPAAVDVAKTDVIALVKAGKLAEADAALDNLMTGLPPSVEKGLAIHEIASAYKDAKDYNRTIDLARYVLANWPQEEFSVWAQMHVAWSYVALGDRTTAKAETNKLIANYKNNPYLPWALHVIAELHRWLKNYDEATGLYRLIIEQHPGSSWAARAKLGLSRAEALSLIDSGHYEKASQAIDKLRTDFAGDPELAQTLRDLAVCYKWSEKYEDAERCYRLAAEANDQPQTQVSLDVQKTKIMSLIEAGSHQQARSAMDQLVASCANDPNLPETIYWFARRYEWSNDYDRAKDIYDQIVQRYADSRFAAVARLDIAKGRILGLLNVGDNARLLRMADQLIGDFPNDSFLTEAALRLQTLCDSDFISQTKDLPKNSKEYLQKAIVVWLDVLRQSPDSSLVPWGWHLAADCLRLKLADHTRALEYYLKVVDDWPDYRYAGDAHFAVAKCCEALRDAGALPEPEAGLKIEQAYTAVTSNYPECTSAGQAFVELGWLKLKKGDWGASAEAFEKALGRYPPESRPAHLFYPLGRAYEQLGRLDKAAAAYNEFIKSVSTDDPRTESVKGRLKNLPVQSQ